VRRDLCGGEAALKGLVLHGGLLLDAEARLLQQLQGFLHVRQLFLRRLELESAAHKKLIFGGNAATTGYTYNLGLVLSRKIRQAIRAHDKILARSVLQ
jgi:hypothetical protein